MKTLWTTLILILSASAFGQNMTWSQWYALTGKNKLVTTDANGEPSGSMGTISGTNVTLFGGLFSDDATITNLVKAGAINQGATKILTAGQHLTNIADIASSTAVAQVLSGTNTSAIGNVTAATLGATNLTSGKLVGIGTAGLLQNGTLANWTNTAGIFDGTTNYVGGDGAIHTMPSAAAGGTTNMMTVAMSCASATLSPTFAISGLQAAANGPRRVMFTVDYLTNSITTINAPGGTLTDGDTMIFRITQGGQGADYTVAGWNAVYKFGSDITGFTASTVASNPGNSTNATDYINFQYDATKTQWHPTGSVRGY